MRLRKTYQYFIELIKSVVINKKIDSSNILESEIKEIESLAKLHGIECLIMEAFKKNDISFSDAFYKTCKINSFKAYKQGEELNNIEALFKHEKIDFMPLKGSLISKMYPREELRNKADIDILVKEEDLKKAGKVLVASGYKVDRLGGNHDSYKVEPFIKVELHRSLIDDAYSSHEYFKDVWNSDYIYNDGYKYNLKEEYFYIFLLSHAFKHFTNSGFGFRLLIDLYYYFKYLEANNTKLDFNLISSELEKLGLIKYNKIVLDTIDYLFKENECSDDIIIFLDYVIASGAYGTIRQSSAIGVRESGSNKKYLFRRLFPPFKMMKKRNPILKKVPILLPWFYFTRLLKGLFHFKSTKVMYDASTLATENDIEKVKKIREIVGAEDEN